MEYIYPKKLQFAAYEQFVLVFSKDNLHIHCILRYINISSQCTDGRSEHIAHVFKKKVFLERKNPIYECF